MASHATLVLMLQTVFLVAFALAWSMEGVRGEEAEALGAELVTTVARERSPFVRRQLIGMQYAAGWSRSRGPSCSHNKAICTKIPHHVGLMCCGNSCTNVKKDHNHCGACGKKCRWSETCCGGKCVHLSTDENNCGKCGMECYDDGCKYGVCHYNSWGDKY